MSGGLEVSTAGQPVPIGDAKVAARNDCLFGYLAANMSVICEGAPQGRGREGDVTSVIIRRLLLALAGSVRDRRRLPR